MNKATKREEWLEKRHQGIGGSDAAVLFGVSPWESPYSLWAKKSGLMADAGPEGEWLEWGTKLEPLVAEKYAAVTGRVIEEKPFELTIHPAITCMVGTPDRFILGAASATAAVPWEHNSRTGVLECKTTNAFERHAWDEEAPLYYQIQLQHYMAITGLPMGSFAVLIGGNTFRWYDVQRNPGFIATLEEKCQEFWRRVETGNAPPVDGSKATGAALKALHPDDNGETIELSPYFGDLAVRRQQIRDSSKVLDAEAETIDNEIRAALGDNTYGLVAGLGVFSLKTSKRGEYTVKASQSRRLRWKGTK